jgi:hypothetical protein
MDQPSITQALHPVRLPDLAAAPRPGRIKQRCSEIWGQGEGMRLRWALSVSILLLTQVTPAHAYPEWPIRVVVPYAAGGATGLVAPALAVAGEVTRSEALLKR